jgi:phospholipid/cholesterol/gamma-HCH transport system substrate-binding protein
MNRPTIKPMRERNQIAVAIVGTALAAALVLLSINLSKVPFLNPHHTYHADFANAVGLKGGDDVRIEGISVGSVASIRVEGDHVRVSFTVKNGIHIGDQSHASIEVATVLGNLFMQVESGGSGRLSPGGTIPVTRTAVPYTLLGALDQFGSFSQQTDLDKLRTSLHTLAATLAGISPKDADAALKGLSQVSQTLASKQQQITSILDSTSAIAQTLNSNAGALVALLAHGDEFLQLLEQRHAVISQLLADTANLGAQLSALITKNGAQLGPLLANLNAVTAVLAKDKAQLQNAVVNLGHFSVNIANATGSGPWLDLLSPTAAVPDNVLKACGATPSGKGPCG